MFDDNFYGISDDSGLQVCFYHTNMQMMKDYLQAHLDKETLISVLRYCKGHCVTVFAFTGKRNPLSMWRVKAAAEQIRRAGVEMEMDQKRTVLNEYGIMRKKFAEKLLQGA